ncbi:MAG: type II secretion system F family protein [Thermoplasmata archaeon]
MDFMIISAVIFIISLIIIELSLYSYRNMRSTQRAQLKKRLGKYTFTEDSRGDIVKHRKLSEIKTLNRILLSSTIIRKMDQLVLQANVKYPLGVYVLTAFFLGATSGMITMILTDVLIAAIMVGILFLFLPYLYLVYLKKKRGKKFQAQLHEGLDLIARALRSGHSFTSAMQVAGDEFDDPLGTEFEETIDEINFGVSVPVALKNMMTRMDCRDLNFFVVSVIIQRETGGNLAELIESPFIQDELSSNASTCFSRVFNLGSKSFLNFSIVEMLPLTVFKRAPIDLDQLLKFDFVTRSKSFIIVGK